MGATVEELEALFNLDRKSLRKIELGKSILQSTIDKSPASRDPLPSLKSRLAENRKQKYRLK
jgi:hypothetical protein